MYYWWQDDAQIKEGDCSMIIKYARVTSISPFRVTFLGEENESKTQYNKLATYTPNMDDMVAFLVDEKNKYICLGKTN